MNVFISADIEGTCGITVWPETERSTPQDYEPFQKQMTREVRAACLYNVGTMIGDIFSPTYNFLLPGHSYGLCTTYGKLTGEYIAENE